MGWWVNHSEIKSEYNEIRLSSLVETSDCFRWKFFSKYAENPLWAHIEQGRMDISRARTETMIEAYVYISA